MILHLYTICWNEEEMLPFFFQHYDSFVDRYIVFDDGSTDNSTAILEAHPRVELRKLPRVDEDSYVLAAQQIHETCWKESIGIADWVIYTAIDEFLYTKKVNDYLYKCQQKGITALPALGYQMISEQLPEKSKPIYAKITAGAPWNPMSKLSIFNPNAVLETNFTVGRHTANPIGNIVYPKWDRLLNLHYKYINFEKTFQRHLSLEKKLGKVDKANRWGYEYSWSKEQLRDQWTFFSARLHSNVFSFFYLPTIMHSPLSERWWRKDSSVTNKNTLHTLLRRIFVGKDSLQ